MSFLDRLVERDRRLAATKYANARSASDQPPRVKPGRTVADAAAKGQAWEDEGRKREMDRGRGCR